MKPPASARKSSRSSASSKEPVRTSSRSASRLVICVRNEGYEASLELRKIYRVVDDAEAESHGLLRVIDESGDDYLYPSASFLPVVLPLATRRAILAAV
jgi:hypothetical protein